ncbi:MAG: META domain-containing protein [Methylobacteriaceae bacterium]|nr:META domain-containing protein [Methylobacteriaceae bacterium]
MSWTMTVARASLAALCAVAWIGSAEAQTRRGKKTDPAKEQSAEERYRQEKTYPTKVTWTLRAINNKPVPAGADITLMIDDNYRGSGFAGCNNWSATIYPLRGQKLAAGPIALTKRKCEPAKMQLERAFLVGVHSGPTWDLEGSDLILKGQGGAMRFDRAL